MTPPLLLLAGINLLAHFIPFERSCLSLDSLARWAQLMAHGPSIAWTKLTTVTTRPILSFMHYPLLWVAGEDPFLGALLVYLSSTLLVWTVYLLLRHLLGSPEWAFLCALFYLLLPNKEQLTHTLDFTDLNLAVTVYVVSFLLFVLFVQRGRPLLLGLSLLAYATGLFWYEMGFFLPILLSVYAGWVNRRRVWAAGLFLAPLFLYVARRLDWFGPAGPGAMAKGLRWDQLSSNLFQMVPNLYFGRQMAKGLLYGLSRFPTVEFPWVWVLAAANLLALYAWMRWHRRISLPPLGAKWIPSAVAIFFVLIAPALLTWGVLGRHTVLSSIGLALLAAVLL